MKFPAVLAIVFAASWPTCEAPARAASEEVSIARVWIAHRDAAYFSHISEYVSGTEVPRREIVLRSQPGDRAGFYFTVRLDGTGNESLPARKVTIHVIRPTGGAAETFNFAIAPGERRTAQLEIGLTGADWPHGNTLPLAWRLEILDASGATLATKQSFLWEKPGATEK